MDIQMLRLPSGPQLNRWPHQLRTRNSVPKCSPWKGACGQTGWGNCMQYPPLKTHSTAGILKALKRTAIEEPAYQVLPKLTVLINLLNNECSQKIHAGKHTGIRKEVTCLLNQSSAAWVLFFQLIRHLTSLTVHSLPAGRNRQQRRSPPRYPTAWTPPERPHGEKTPPWATVDHNLSTPRHLSDWSSRTFKDSLLN